MTDLIDRVVTETGWARERAEAFVRNFGQAEDGVVVAAAAVVRAANDCPHPHIWVDLQLMCSGEVRLKWRDDIPRAELAKILRDLADQVAEGDIG